jgi:LuxR family maltose regulon positive regulatory protein
VRVPAARAVSEPGTTLRTARTRAPRPPAPSPTKLHPPRFRPEAVRRSRLTDVLRDGRPRLGVIVAPPGYGKTLLLADWAEVDDRTFAWVSIDPQDNDPTVLWSCIGAAIGRAIGGSAAGERFPALALAPDPGAALLAAMDADHRQVVLVLDDFHLIENDVCHESLLRFANAADGQVQLVLSSRTEPPVPIARLRASGDLLELRAADMRFTFDESVAFLNDSLGLGLDASAVGVLHERTEGWPAGLYLAYLSLRSASDPLAFVAAFGASNRHVMDYLTEQVLVSQEPEVLHFMLATSIVDQISGPLADALTGETDSQDRLTALERANVFLAPLDDRREWYRYHNLLSELLRLELVRRNAALVPLLHSRASAWFEEAGDDDRAIRHAAAARDLPRAAKLISEHYLAMLEWGRISTVASWLDALGPRGIGTDPRLGIVKAWTMHLLGRHEEARTALAVAVRSDIDGPLPDGTSSIAASAAIIEATFPGGDIGQMLASARRAYELEVNRDSPWRISAHTLLGFALLRSGRYEEARGHLEVGAGLAAQSSMWVEATSARMLLARTWLGLGDLAQADANAHEANALSETHQLAHTPTGANALAILGTVLVAQGEVARGEALLEAALPAIRILGEPITLAETLLDRAVALQGLGRHREAVAHLEEAGLLVDMARDPGVLRIRRRIVDREITGAHLTGGATLSAREIEVLRLLAQGVSKREAAERLFVSYNTVHSHARTIYRKLNVGSRAAAIERATELGILA